MNVLKTILQYLIGIFFLFMSLSYTLMGGQSVIGAFISIAMALLIIPFTRNIVENKFNFKLNKVMKYSLPFIGFFTPFFFVNTEEINKENQSYKKLEKINDSISINLDTISQDSTLNIASNKVEVKTIMPIASLNTNENNINKSKERVVKKKSTKKKKNYKGSTKRHYKKSKPIKKRSKKIQPSTSGVCGHANKTGGYCKRRVRGGGYCWQHR